MLFGTSIWRGFKLRITKGGERIGNGTLINGLISEIFLRKNLSFCHEMPEVPVEFSVEFRFYLQLDFFKDTGIKNPKFKKNKGQTNTPKSAQIAEGL